MDKKKQAKLEAAGWRVGDAAEFVGLPEWHNTMWDVENALRSLVRSLRKAQGISQKVLAERIGSTQSNMAAIENGDPRYGVELALKAVCALGATTEQIAGAINGEPESKDSKPVQVAA